jgi:hypothetical protein
MRVRTALKGGARRDAARRTEQLAILSVAMVLGGVGLAFHPLWIAAVVLMAVLWGYMASDIRSAGGGVVPDVVGAVVGEAKEVSKAASWQVSAADQEPTRRELYARARAADVQGRSGMSKEELKEALEA